MVLALRFPAAQSPSFLPFSQASACSFSLVLPLEVKLLDFARFRLRISNHTHGLARPLARPRICRCPLAAHRQAATMTNSAVGIDGLQSLQVALNFAAQITFN